MGPPPAPAVPAYISPSCSWFYAGACDLRADGGGGGRPAEPAGIRAAVALGAGGVLVGGRRRSAGDRGLAGASERGADADGLAKPLKRAAATAPRRYH